MSGPLPEPPDTIQLTLESPELHGYDGPTVDWWLEVKKGGGRDA